MLMVIWIVLSLNFFLTVVFCLCSQITSCFLCLVRMKLLSIGVSYRLLSLSCVYRSQLDLLYVPYRHGACLKV